MNIIKHYLLKNSFLRGVLCLLLCIVGIASAWGEENTATITLIYSDVVGKGTSGGGGGFNHTISPITFKFSNAYGNSAHIKSYGSSTITFSGATITKIVITATSNEYIKTWKEGTKDITISGKTATWKGSSNNVTLKNNSSSQARISTIVVTYEVDTNAPTLESIAISGTPSTTTYYVGDTPSAKGLIVKAVYSDESEIDVTDEVTWTFNPETITAGTTQVSARAEYGGEDAEKTFDVTINPAPIEYFLTLDLTTKTYYEATTTHVYWDANVAELATYRKNSSTTAANNYLGGDSNNSTSSRFYTDNTVTITPKANVTQVVFYTNSDTFAKALLASNYTNATFSREQNSNNIIIKPQNSNNQIAITMAGTCGCTAIKLYYQPINVTLSSAGYATFCLPYNAIVPEGMTAYTATDNGESVKLTAKESNKIAAGEGVILKGKEGTYTFVAAEGNVNATESNQLVGVTKDTQLSASDNAYMLTRDKNTNAIAFRRLATTTPYTLSANKAYLKLNGGDESRQLISVTWDDNATSIYELKGKKDVHDGAIYNLAGQKLIHTQKGINIINGKLVIK